MSDLQHTSAEALQRQWRCHRAREEVGSRRSARAEQQAVEWQTQLNESATVVQRGWRCYAARSERRRRKLKRDGELKAMVRTERHSSACTIQRFARGVGARQEVARRRSTRLSEWSAEDEDLCRQEQNDAASLIQSLWKGHRDRLVVAGMKQQRLVASSKATEMERECAAVLIQSAQRQSMARRKVADMLRARRNLCTHQVVHDAAVTIQSALRARRQYRHLRGMRHRRRYWWWRRQREESAVRIQNIARARRSRRAVAKRRLERREEWAAEQEAGSLEDAALMLDRTGHPAAELLYAVARAAEVAPVLRRLRLRGHEEVPVALSVAKTLALSLAPTEAGVGPEPANLALITMLRQATEPSERADAAATTVQQFVRAFQSRRARLERLAALPEHERSTFPQTVAAADAEMRQLLSPGTGLSLLLPGRGQAADLECTSALSSMFGAEMQALDAAASDLLGRSPRGPAGPVCRLQRHGRGATVRARLSVPARRRQAAARVIQRSVPALLRTMESRASARQQRRRGVEGRRAAAASLRRSEAALCIQLAFRSCLARSSHFERDSVRREQRRLWRAEMESIDAEMTDNAVRTLQRAERCRRARQRVSWLRRDESLAFELLLERDAAEWRAEMIRQEAAATALQVWYRGLCMMERVRLARLEAKAHHILFDAAVTIQSGVRGMVARLAVRRTKQQHQAAREIQRVALGMLGRRRARARAAEVHRNRCATKIQAQARRVSAVERVELMRADAALRVLQEGAEIAACMIQRAARCLRARRRSEAVRARRRRRDDAATKISSLVRGHLTRVGVLVDRRRLRALELQQLTITACVGELVRLARGLTARVALKRLHVDSHAASTNIARVWRGHVGRRRAGLRRAEAAAQIAAVQRHAAAVVIQSHWRAAVARTELRRRRYRKQDAARGERWRLKMLVRLQAFGRASAGRRRFQVMKRKCIEASGRVQRMWRGYLVRKVTGPMLLRKRQTMAARVLQYGWRRNRRKLEQLADERQIVRRFTRMQLTGVVREERGGRMGIALRREEGLAYLRGAHGRAVADLLRPQGRYESFVAALPHRAAFRAARRIQKLWRVYTARSRVRSLRATRDADLDKQRRRKEAPSRAPSYPIGAPSADASRVADEIRYERAKCKDAGDGPIFRSFSTVPHRHREWLEMFAEMRVPLRPPLRRLLSEESSMRGALELEAAVDAERIAAPLRALPPFLQGWRSRPRPTPVVVQTPKLLPPLGGDGVETIALRLGDSVHNCPSSAVTAAFGSPAERPPLPKWATGGKEPMRPLAFHTVDQGGDGLRASAESSGAVEALRHLVCLDDPAVTVVDLAGNGLTDQHVHPLLSGLRGNSFVRIVDLRGNHLRDATAEALAHLLRVNSSITAIDLGDTQVTDVGASHIAAALSTNGSLRRLNLAGTLVSGMERSALAAKLRARALQPTAMRPSSQPRVGPPAVSARLKRRPPGPSKTGAPGRCDITVRPGAAGMARDAVARRFGGTPVPPVSL
eukprot:TRINITY_DN9865_c1_g1_i1.p1 TRINITY_DN9865_c1_g1~~TRINITY_DN9865_c1_g1_i1.p1  ORF type:complete len:1501 (+),score=446.05 TRINITY_DN9865_c1_g1_i1:61-4563(+)